jgi:hypothetical protein
MIMKSSIIKLNILFLFLAPSFIYGQKVEKEAVYRRSSLYTLMINEPTREYADVIHQTFINSPIPEKFNNHILDARDIPNGIQKKLMRRAEKIKIQEKNISNYFSVNSIAKAIVARWFNRKSDGTFDMKLVANRGSYNATEMDVDLARSSKRGLALLADAGEELIGNTFVIVNDFDYVNKEEAMGKIKEKVTKLTTLGGRLDKNIKTKRLDKAEKLVGKGYVVRTTSYLYQLDWSDSVAAVFYEQYWMDENSLDENKKKAFDNSSIFKLKLVGQETAWADLRENIHTTKSEEELIRIATVRAIDAVIAKLQRKYEVFRTKTPLYGVNPLAAKIGMKEGLEAGDRFEVLEQVMDEEGRTRYKRRGIVQVDKNHIWDNRHMAEEEPQDMNPASSLGFTKFRGVGKFYKGMLVRQIN